ncbi:MAG: hypothetical protein QXZ09_08960, partial [Candidatus Methanomethylicaceae archaeon]
MNEYMIASIMVGEAGICGQLGMLAVAFVIMNRGGIDGFYGRGTPTQEAIQLASMVLHGSVEDPTHGAL